MTAMKRFSMSLLAAGFVTMASGAALADDPKPIALGAKVPAAETKLKSVTSDKEITLAKSAGPHGTLVVFTCNNCPYAKAWEERIVTIGNSYAKKGVGVVLVNSNSPSVSKGDTYELTKARAKERGVAVPYAVDPDSQVAKAFGATKTPEAFLFDKGGSLVYHGTIDDNHEEASKVQKPYLKDALDAVVKGQKPATAETKSLGCGIKFPKTS